MHGRAALRSYLTSPLLAAPLTVVAGISLTAAAPLLGGLGLVPHGILHFTVATAFCAGLGYAGGRAAARSAFDPKAHQRGAVVVDEPERSTARDGEITLAGKAIPAADESKHFNWSAPRVPVRVLQSGKFSTPPWSGGTGRSSRTRMADISIVFYDSARGDIVLNPFDERSVEVGPIRRIENSYDVDQLARSLIPDHEGADRSWRGYAAHVLQRGHAAGP